MRGSHNLKYDPKYHKNVLKRWVLKLVMCAKCTMNFNTNDVSKNDGNIEQGQIGPLVPPLPLEQLWYVIEDKEKFTLTSYNFIIGYFFNS